MKKYSGWLVRTPDAPWEIRGVPLDPKTRTRREEYNWVLDVFDGAPPMKIVDVASGYVPGWHILPELLAGMGHSVTAVDIDVRSRHMPSVERVVRVLEDATDLPFPNDTFDAAICISSVEHMDSPNVAKTLAEMVRVTKPSGWLVLTADEGGFLPSLLRNHCDFGAGDGLDPAVYAIAGQVRK